jgi:hypothetical protein
MERILLRPSLFLGLILNICLSWAAFPHDDCIQAFPLASPSPASVACGGGQWQTNGRGIDSLFVVSNTGPQSATHSTTSPQPGCGWINNQSQDVWFKLQIPLESDGIEIEWKNEGGCSGFLCNTDLRVATYRSGSNGSCSQLVYLDCVEKDRFHLQALGNPGDWIYLRAWERDDQGFQIRFTRIRAIQNDCDDCFSAPTLPFSEPFDCSTLAQQPLSVSYDFNRSNGARATPSGIAPLAADCQGVANPEDVWLSLQIPPKTGGVEIQFENKGGCIANGSLNICQTDVAYAWYTTSTGDCSGLEFRGCGKVTCLVGCSDGKIRVDGRPGERVYVRLWEEQDQGFDIQINQLKPTAPADKCYTALPLEGIGCNYEATSPKSGPYAEPDNWGAFAHTGTSFCDPPTNQQLWATNENLIWYTFNQPVAGPLTLNIQNISCQGLGITPTLQMGVFSNAGGPQNPSCDLNLETAYGCAVGTGAVALHLPSLPAGEYLLVVDGTGGNQCTWEFRGDNVFPVNLVSFEAHREERAAVLSWVTTDEVNNAGFEILRAEEGGAFEAVDFLEAQPAPNGPDGRYEYQYLDVSIFEGGRFQYRLKQVDLDGSYTMSDVVEVSLPVDAQAVSLGRIYPNPVREELHIPFVLGQQAWVRLDLVSMNGQQHRYFPEGMKSFGQGKHEIVWDLTSLPRGLYVLRFQAGGKAQTRRVVVR